MSTLQVGNLHLDSTGGNRIHLLSGSNTYVFVSGGANVVTVNSSSLTFSTTLNVSSFAVGSDISINTTAIAAGSNVVANTTGIKVGSAGITFSDSTSQTSAAKGVNVQSFTGSGTWTKPAGYAAGSRVYIQAWGGGGSGGKSTYGAGGGGGGYNERWALLSDMGATETVTIGAGGAALSATGTGITGGTTSVGTLLSAYGGAGGNAYTGPSIVYGGGGGGQISAGTTTAYYIGCNLIGTLPGLPWYPSPENANSASASFYYQGGGAGPYNMASGSNSGRSAMWHGGGGAAFGTNQTAGTSQMGGGGGGASSTNITGGTSIGGGNGGNGGTTGTAGTQPAGGGGGGTTGNSGAGGAGKVIITVFAG